MRDYLRIAVFWLGSLAVLLLGCLCIAILMMRPPKKAAVPEPTAPPVIARFDPINMEKTSAWLMDVSAKFVADIPKLNDVRQADDLAEIRKRISEEVKFVTVRWELPVQFVSGDTISFRNEIPFESDRFGGHHPVHLSVECYPGSKGPEDFILLGGIKIGESISFEDAAKLDRQSTVVVEGDLKKFEFSGWDRLDPQVSYTAVIENSKIVGIGRQKQPMRK
jgi:hypothetical protein